MRWYVWPDTQEIKGPEYMWSWVVSGVLTVCYESIKRQMKRRPIYECRWDERLGWQLFIMKHWKKRYIKDQRSEVTNFVMTSGHDHPWSRRHDRSWHMVTSLKVLARSVRSSHDLWRWSWPVMTVGHERVPRDFISWLSHEESHDDRVSIWLLQICILVCPITRSGC